jgi:hypothetical protein
MVQAFDEGLDVRPDERQRRGGKAGGWIAERMNEGAPRLPRLLRADGGATMTCSSCHELARRATSETM